MIGTEVVVSDALPIHPTDGEDARRIVRQGLADVLRWLGEDVGPKPGEETHVYWYVDGSPFAEPKMMVSRSYYRRLCEQAVTRRPQYQWMGAWA